MSLTHAHAAVPLELLGEGDIVLFHGHSPVSRLIQFAQDSYWNHVAMVVVVVEGDALLLESSGYGVRPQRLSRYRWDDKMVVRPVNYTKDRASRAVSRAFGYGGRLYDYPFILRYGLSRLLGIRLEYRPDDLLICSEMVVEAWRGAGVELLPKGVIPIPKHLAREAMKGIRVRLVWGPERE